MWNIPCKQYCLLIGPDLPCCTGQSDIRHAGSNRCASAPRHMRFLSLLAWYLMVTWLALAGVILQVAPTRSGRFCVVKQSNWRCQTMHNFGSKTAWIISVSEEDRKFCWMFILAKDLWDSLSLASHFISEKVSLLSNRTLPCWRLCLWCPVQSPVAGQNTSPSPEQILVLDIALLPSKQFFLRQSDRDWAKRACLHSYKARPRFEWELDCVRCVTSVAISPPFSSVRQNSWSRFPRNGMRQGPHVHFWSFTQSNGACVHTACHWNTYYLL